MATTYIEILGSAADAAMALPEVWNTPQTSVPGAYSTIAMQKAVARLLNQMGANVPQDGDKNGKAFVAALTQRFGASYAADYRWREIVEALYADVQAGKKLDGGGAIGFLAALPGPKVSGIPLLPVAVGLGLLWYFTKGKKRRSRR